MNELYYNKFKSLSCAADLKFSVCKQKTKAPFEDGWNEDKNLLSLDNLKELIDKTPKQNWGVMGGRGVLIIDIDSELTEDNKLFNAVNHIFRPTLMTKTPKGLHAIYYYTEDLPSLHLDLKDNGNTLGEYRNSYTQHTIEAGSVHPNGKKYDVMNDNDIALFDLKDYDQLISLFVPKPPKKVKKTKSKNKDLSLIQPVNTSLNDVCELLGVKESKFKKKKDKEYGDYLEWKGFLPGHEKENGEIYNNTVKYFPDDGHVAWNCFAHPTQDESKRNWTTLKAMVKGVCTCEETAAFDDDIKSQIIEHNKQEFIAKAIEINTDTVILNIDKISKDPLHDLLMKYSLYLSILKSLSNTMSGDDRAPSEYESYIISIFTHMGKVKPDAIVDEMIKYSDLMKNEYFQYDINRKFETSYYNIINKFIYNITPERYLDFVNAYNETEYTVNDIQFSAVFEYLNSNDVNKDYQMNLKKWLMSVNKDFLQFNFDDIIDSVDKQEFIIENFLVDDGISLVSADKGAGKTFFAMDMQVAIATGREFMGLKTKKSAVMFVDFENGRNVMNPRYKGLFNGYDLTDTEKEDLRKNLIVEIKQSGWGFVYKEGNELRINEANLNELLNRCAENNVKLVMFDPLVNLGQFQETNEDYTYLKNKIFDRFIQKGIAVLLLHHLTKGADKNGKKSARGGGALEGFVVTSYHLQIAKFDMNGNAKRNVLLKNKGRNGELNTLSYDIDIKDKLNDDNTKEYEFIKLNKVVMTNGLSPEQIDCLNAMDDQEYYTTQDFLHLLYGFNLIPEVAKLSDGKYVSKYAGSHAPNDVKQMMVYIDKLEKGRHTFKTSEGKKIAGNVYVLKKEKLNSMFDWEDEE